MAKKTGNGSRRGTAQECAVIADADVAVNMADGAASCLPELASIDCAAGASWAPLSSDSAEGNGKRRREPLPYELKSHNVKAHLKDRTTAVVDMCTVVDAPHDVLFGLLADPHQHEDIFDSIESARAELVSEEGPVRRWRLDYRARWKFWKVGGVCDNRLWMTTDSERGTVSFQLREPGFLRKYEGTWTITGPRGKGPGGGGGGGCASPAPSGSAASAPFPPFVQSPCSASALPAAAGSSYHSGGGGGSGGGAAGGPFAGGRGLGFLFASINSPFLNAPPFAAAALRNPFSAKTNACSGPSAGMPPAVAHSLAGTDNAGAASGVSPVCPAAAAVAAVPRSPTTIVVHKSMSPKVAPPFPVNQVLKGHACGQVNDMLEGLLFAAARRISEAEAEADGPQGAPHRASSSK